MDVPSNFKRVFSEAQIQEALDRIASAISPWAERIFCETGRELVAAPILRGGIVFFADLIRRIPVCVEWQPLRASAYEDSTAGKPKREVKVDLMGFIPSGRSILLVDEICDSGRTLQRVSDVLKEEGALEVQSTALVSRSVEDVLHAPAYVGFLYEGPEWLAGYGLKGGAHYGHLPEIYAITSTRTR